jgi:uncharacterized protein YfaS (alpha-2-macroglobulin family)
MCLLDRRHFLRNIAITPGVLAVTPLLAQPAQDAPASDNLLDEKAAAALRSAHEYLVGRQQENGAFGTSGYRGNVAVCSLAGMALMSAGSTPGRGPHATAVNRFLSYVLAATQDSGFISVTATASHGPMYDHGFATLFLAECYGMSQRGDLREKLSKAVKLIVSTQNNEGGWRYLPQRDEADVSVTVCQVMALRAARNAGMFVPAETVQKAVDYVKRCQNPDGGFMYRLPSGESAFPRSAAALVALYSAGIYDSPEVVKGLEYLQGFRPRADLPSRAVQNYFYGHYYAVQAMWHARGKAWPEWYRAVRDDLVGRQANDGSWQDPYGREYATAMACLVLQMPSNYLPIFQR